MSRIIQPGKNKSLTKHDVNRELNNHRDAIQYINTKLETIDGLFSEFINFMEQRDKFKKYLDEKAKKNGKHQQPTSK